MLSNKLIINKGEYILSKQDSNGKWEIKLIVYYQKRNYRWFWIKQDNQDWNKDEFIAYITDFAKRMIDSKANLNFYN